MADAPKAKKSGGRFGFFSGILFVALIVGAVGYFVPMIDCPSCEPKSVNLEAGEVASPGCADCTGRGILTGWNWLRLEKPELKSPVIAR